MTNEDIIYCGCFDSCQLSVCYDDVERWEMKYNEELLDAITVVSFLIGIANYGENLSQSDKDDMMQALDRKTNDMIERLENDLEEQNKMLKEILDIMKGEK